LEKMIVDKTVNPPRTRNVSGMPRIICGGWNERDWE
jgi:hypothetical protein